MIRFECPHCGKGLRTDDGLAGEAFTCPGCRGRVRVPKAGDSRTSARGSSLANRFTVKPYCPPPFWTSGRILRALAAATLTGVAATLFLWPLPLPSNHWILWSLTGACALAAAFLVFSVCAFARHPECSRCYGWKHLRELGTIERDTPSAKDALEAGDLAALGALSPEGETITISIAQCAQCGRDAPIDVQFATQGQEIAHVTYPGGALPAFERLATSPPIQSE